MLDRVVATTGMGHSPAGQMLTRLRLPHPAERVEGVPRVAASCDTPKSWSYSPGCGGWCRVRTSFTSTKTGEAPATSPRSFSCEEPRRPRRDRDHPGTCQRHRVPDRRGATGMLSRPGIFVHGHSGELPAHIEITGENATRCRRRPRRLRLRPSQVLRDGLRPNVEHPAIARAGLPRRRNATPRRTRPIAG